jgi:hypothetical protein
MTTIADVKNWIKELIPGEAYDKYVHVIKDEGEGTEDGSIFHHELIVKIFTKSRHYYYIVAKDENDNTGYLGCQAGNNYYWAGEDHTRGHDLPDGPLDESTWLSIVKAIIRDELRELGT